MPQKVNQNPHADDRTVEEILDGIDAIFGDEPLLTRADLRRAAHSKDLMLIVAANS